MMWQEIIVAVCVLLAATAVIRNLIAKKGSSCGSGGCGGCGSQAACSTKKIEVRHHDSH